MKRRLAAITAGLALASCASMKTVSQSPATAGLGQSPATAGLGRSPATAGLGEPPALTAAGEPLRTLLRSRPKLVEALRNADEQRVQIVLGWIENDASGRPVLRQAGFRAGAEYFYPASSVKTFAAVAALEKLAKLRRETGLPIDRDTPMELFPLFEGEKLEQGDATHVAGGTITVGHEVRKLALVSDNEAFNRLYELVGQDGLAASLARAGLTEPWIVHRLSEFRSPEEHRRYPRTDFVGATFRHTIPERSSAALQPPPPLPKLFVGKGYMSNEALVSEPMDFSGKNRISLVDLQRGLCKIVRPDAACGGGPAFALEEGDRDFLIRAMTETPRQSPDPIYDPKEFPDDYVKNLLPGLLREIPGTRLRIVNKTGEAYGFSIDNAFVEDRSTGRSLFLAATIYTNEDGILNDDRYEYATVARPFFAELGRALGASLATPPKKSP